MMDRSINSQTVTPISEPFIEVSAVVASHDGFADVWPGFFNLLFRFWPDLPFPLYLISNNVTFPDGRIIGLRVGDDLSWSDTLARGLEQISSQFILLILDDFFLTGPVDTALVRRLHTSMLDQGAVYLRLRANPKPDRICPHDPNIGLIAKRAPYRASLQVAFWDRLILLSLLRRGESAWDFELKGSRRSDEIVQPFLCVCDGLSVIPYRHVIQRGKYLPDAIRYFAQFGIRFDPCGRAVESELYLRWQASPFRRALGRAWRFVRPLP
jgi:hypothetical protein